TRRAQCRSPAKEVTPMQALARWCFKQRWTVVALWLVALFGVRAVAIATGTDYNDNFQPPGTESASVQQMLSAAAPNAAGDTSRIVFSVKTGSLSDTDERSRVEATLSSVAHLPHVTGVTSPFAPGADGQLAPGGHIGY